MIFVSEYLFNIIHSETNQTKGFILCDDDQISCGYLFYPYVNPRIFTNICSWPKPNKHKGHYGPTMNIKQTWYLRPPLCACWPLSKASSDKKTCMDMHILTQIISITLFEVIALVHSFIGNKYILLIFSLPSLIFSRGFSHISPQSHIFWYMLSILSILEICPDKIIRLTLKMPFILLWLNKPFYPFLSLVFPKNPHILVFLFPYIFLSSLKSRINLNIFLFSSISSPSVMLLTHSILFPL